MLKKIALTLTIAIFACAAQVFAQTEIPAEKRAAIRELITLVNADNKTEDMMNMFLAQMDSMRDAIIKTVLDERADLTPAERRAFEETLIADQKAASKRILEKLLAKLNFNEMLDEIAAIVYDKHYTLEEIRELTAFYKTPLGQKMLKTMTPLANDSMQLTSERMIAKIPGILKEIQDEEKMEIERVVNAKKPKGKKAPSK